MNASTNTSAFTLSAPPAVTVLACQRRPAAAFMITRAVTAGGGVITPGEAVFTVVVVAFMRFAMKRSSLVPIAKSALGTMYHEGIVRQAGTPVGTPSAASE